MKKLKTIEEIESGITYPRFLALFRAFVKALESKDYGICRKLTILRSIICKFEKINFDYGIKIVYRLVLLVLKERDYFYWEIKLLDKYLLSNNQ